MATEGLTRFTFSQMHMGVAVRITLFATGRAVAENAGMQAFGRFAGLDRALSDYLQTSELSKLVDGAGQGPVEVGSDLFDVLALSKDIAEESDGAFDVTAAPVTVLWREAVGSGRLPASADLAAASRLVGHDRMRLDPPTRSVRLELGTRIDLGGVGKGYACDQTLAALRDNGIDRAMVQAGGDIAVSGPPPGAEGWSISVERLHAPPFRLRDKALSTSGDAFQSLDVDGVRHSHVVDPRTGLAATHGVQSTVVGPSCAVTDALATLAGVDLIQAQKLARRYGAEVFVTSME